MLHQLQSNDHSFKFQTVRLLPQWDSKSPLQHEPVVQFLQLYHVTASCHCYKNKLSFSRWKLIQSQVFLLSEWGFLVLVTEISHHGYYLLWAAFSVLEPWERAWVGVWRVNWEFFWNFSGKWDLDLEKTIRQKKQALKYGNSKNCTWQGETLSQQSDRWEI